jgi:3-hydroxybutyryl-CoA dehydrogenase
MGFDKRETKIGLVGTGMIGASLAALFCGNGLAVQQWAYNEKDLEVGMDMFSQYFSQLRDEGLITKEQEEICRSYHSTTFDMSELSDCDCIFECVKEDERIKKGVYDKLIEACPGVRAVASVSSAMTPERLLAGVEPSFAEKFLVAHPYNPPHLVQCFEILGSATVKEDCISLIWQVLEACGRKPVRVLKSAPGFIVNRIHHAMHREAQYMVEQGISTPEEIDRALMYSIAPRYTSIGLFEHGDYAGLDMGVHIHEGLYPDLCNYDKPAKPVYDAVNRGDIGYKAPSKKGMLDWNKKDVEDFKKRASAPYFKAFNWDIPGEKR